MSVYVRKCTIYPPDVKVFIPEMLGDIPWKQFDVVYYMAGRLGAKSIPLSEYQEAHVNLPKMVVSKLKSSQLFVYMSSAWVLQPDKPYEFTKIEGEKVALAGKCQKQIVRPGFIYGEGDTHHLPLFKVIDRLGRFAPIIGNGNNMVCPTYIKDVVDEILKSSKRLIHVAGQPITMKLFCHAIADALGKPYPMFTTSWVSHLPESLKEKLHTDFFAKQRVFPSDIVATSLEKGLKETVRWYRDNEYLSTPQKNLTQSI